MNERLTDWRQGSIIKQDELPNVGIPNEGNKLGIVITHDCDLPQKKEGQIEVIVCEIVKADKNLMASRNVRKLHLIINREAAPLCLELCFQARVIISRESFFGNLSGPDTSYVLDDSEKRVFKQWLSIRYGRPAFPNNFEDRLRVKIGKDFLERKISKLIEPHQEKITGLFISLDEDKYNDLEEGTPYFLSIYIAYKSSDNIFEYRAAAEEIETGINDLFLQAYGRDSDSICLVECKALADNKIALSDLLKLDQWRIEWISLAANDEEFLPTGHY